jgi:deoxyribonuclease-4
MAGSHGAFRFQGEFMNQLVIGPHLSVAKGYARAADEAAKLGATTFQFFTRNPRGGKAKALDPKDIEQYRVRAREQGIVCMLAHAPYTLNAAAAKPEVQDFARQTFADDLQRMETFPGSCYNFHPGSHVGQGVEVGIQKIVAVLNDVLRPEQTTTVLLETMAGKGTEIGRTFQELATIIDGVDLDDHMGVTLDTCHVWDAGYDIRDNLDGVLEEFDRVIGLDRLKAIHLNDSKNPCGSHKDRHECIGKGEIGFEALSAVTRHPALRHLPFYLETPQESLVGYAEEIAALRAIWQ